MQTLNQPVSSSLFCASDLCDKVFSPVGEMVGSKSKDPFSTQWQLEVIARLNTISIHSIPCFIARV